jgi:SulP family sulfate permease
MVVGSLIFYLGAELLKESIYDTFTQGIHYLEYATIILIVAAMGLVGFTEGIILGIILSNIFFVVMYAKRPVIRSLYSGSQLRSTVHRLYRQQKFLDKVGHQISVIKLQGFIFFGTVNQLNESTELFIKGPSQIRFLILDFSLISGIDYSAMEAFQTIARKLIANATHMIFCGLGPEAKKVVSSELFDEAENLAEIQLTHMFDNLNQALEWSENTLLSSYYQRVDRSKSKYGAIYLK